MGGVTFDNRIIATEGGSAGTDSPPWEELVFNTDFLLHSDTSNITSNITISDSRYWKYGKHVTLVMNFLGIELQFYGSYLLWVCAILLFWGFLPGPVNYFE